MWHKAIKSFDGSIHTKISISSKFQKDNQIHSIKLFTVNQNPANEGECDGFEKNVFI